MPQPPRTRQTLPGLTGVDHIGFTVPDLEQARTFLVDVLGCEYMYSLGPFRHDDSDWMAEHLNVHPRAVMQQLHFFRCGGQAIFEVFEYSAPDQDPEQPRNSDIGGHHVALYVDDLDAAVAFLHEQRLTVLGDPTASKGPSEGQRWRSSGACSESRNRPRAWPESRKPCSSRIVSRCVEEWSIGSLSVKTASCGSFCRGPTAQPLPASTLEARTPATANCS